MVFSSVIFLFLFLPMVIFLYFLCPQKYSYIRNLILLFFSMVFYFYGEPKYILVMLLSIVMNYVFGLLVHAEQMKNKKGKIIVIVSVIANLAILIYFKYLSFLTDNVNWLFGSDIHFQKIIMPIGISFFTFQAMSYVFDVYHKIAMAQKNLINVALYISMFPQLMAGPIVRYETVASEIRTRSTSMEKFSQGVIRFIYGLGKKLILANAMGKIADQIFATQTDLLNGRVAWIGAIAYAFQIYFDFSGYSDMAIGLGKIFGFTFLENFNFPYISKSITEFWRRWHMSLGTWFRDYVYIPLGGNRVRPFRHVINIIVVWFLTGFWHGASWNFIVWGLYFAVILILEKSFVLQWLKKLWAPVAHVYAVFFILIGWVIFRSDDLTYALGYLSRMFSPQSLLTQSGQAYYYLRQYNIEWLFAVLFSLPIGAIISQIAEKFESKRVVCGIFYGIRLCYVFGIFMLSILFLVNATFNPFIYFRF